MRGHLLMLIGLVAVTVQSRVIRSALRHADVPLDKTQLYTGRDVRQFAREIDGETNNAITALFKLPENVLSWLGVALINEFGIPAELQPLQRLPKPRVIRMALETSAEKEWTA